MVASIGSARIKFNAEGGHSVSVPIISMQDNITFHEDPTKPCTEILCQTENPKLKQGQAGLQTDTYRLMVDESQDTIWDKLSANFNCVRLEVDDKPERPSMIADRASRMDIRARIL